MSFVDLHIQEFSGADKKFVLQNWVEFDASRVHLLIGNCVDLGDGSLRGFEMPLLLDRTRFEIGIGWECQVDVIDGDQRDDLNSHIKWACNSVTGVNPVG